MSRITLVFEFDGPEPEISAATEFMGGKCVAVQFGDALEELRQLEDEVCDES